ncbi:O-antigen ligase family protein [Salmonella enterica]
MPISMICNNWKNTHTKVAFHLEIITFIFSTITLLIAMVDNNLSMKLFNISSILALLTLIIRGKPANTDWKTMIIPASILFIGVVDIIWYELFKVENSFFRGTYHSYINTAKIFIFGAFMVYLAATSRIKFEKDIILYCFYSISFLIFGLALFQKYSAGMDRVDFGIGTSTGAAYSIMLLGLISAVSILYTQKNHPLLFIVNAVLILAALIMTQTRSTVLIFPIICCIAIATHYNKKPKKLFLSVCAFLVLLIMLGLIFSKPIAHRYEAAVKDIDLYQQDNSHSSLGARLAMYEVGITIFQNEPLKWRSAEERAKKTEAMITHNKSLSSTLPFLNIHLHNELIESASLKGLVGAISTLSFYVALLFSVYYYRSLGLFIFALAIIGLGLSDVIIWSRSIPIIIICGIMVMLLFNSKRER